MCYSAMVEQSKSKLERIFEAKSDQLALEGFQGIQALEQELSPQEVRSALGLARAPKVSQFRWAPDQPGSRVYPGYFAPVIVWQEQKGRTLVPMRYRIRPAGSPKEIPSKYNVFNCRIDSLQSRQTWKRLFGRTHALFPFTRFFEWVEDKKGNKVQLSYAPQDREIMWAPALYDTWSSLDGRINFSSFAILTDEPPPEVAETGHDRCPIFLKADSIDAWLQPEKRTKNELMELLQSRETTTFEHALAA